LSGSTSDAYERQAWSPEAKLTAAAQLLLKDIDQGTVDFRGDRDYAKGKAAYDEVTLPEEVAAHPASYTGRFLAPMLGLEAPKGEAKAAARKRAPTKKRARKKVA